MAQRKKWDHERMKAAIEAIKNKEMAATKHPEFPTNHKQH